MHAKLKIDRSVFLFFLFAVMPFINIINHRVGDKVVYIIFSVLIVVSFLSFKIDKMYSLKLSYIPFFLLMFLILIVIYLNSYSLGNILFFSLFIFVFIYLVTFFDLNRFLKKYYTTLLKYFIVIISLSIIIDSFILHSSLDLSLQLMYSSEAYAYKGRPFGVFGQPSVNSVVLVFIYTLLLSKYVVHKELYNVYFFLVTLGVLLQNSGSGYLAYFMMLMTVFYKYKVMKYSIFPMFGLITFYLVVSNTVSKISLTYMTFLIENSMYLINLWVDSDPSLIDIFFGSGSFGMEFGPLFLITNMGFVYFIVLTGIFLYLMYKGENRYTRVAILILLIGNLHYPVIFFIFTSFVLPLTIYDILNKKNLCK
jgi:hypothetical protein